MRFSNFLLRVDGTREATLEDCKEVVNKGVHTYFSNRQKYMYVIENEICENRFFWMSCDYDESDRYREYVVNKNTGEKEPNPRQKSQIEPRQQFFACFDSHTHFLYLNDLNRRPFFQQYFSEITGRDFCINNVYTSADEFCNRIKSIRGFRYTQVDNLFARSSDIFTQVGNIYGIDTPKKVQIKVSYGDVPVHLGKTLVDRFYKHKDEFEDVVIIGCDDAGVEQTFDFSSVLKHLQIRPHKDSNEHYDPAEVKMLLLEELR